MLRDRVLIALPKGRYRGDSISIAARLCGSEEAALGDSDTVTGEAFNVILAKARDIPPLVADGWVDVGVASEEWVREHECLLEGVGRDPELDRSA
jgi:ATP phosphoribosyltransferase